MDALNFLKFWRHAAMAATSTSFPHLTVEPDNGSDEDDSFFDLELTVHDFDNKRSDICEINDNPQDRAMRESKDDDDVSEKPVSLSSNEPISKRKILPIEPIPKPQSPIALLKSAHSFRIFMFKKSKEMSARKTEEVVEAERTTQKQQKKETKVFALKLNMEESSPFSPSLSRNGSSRSHGSKSERFSKEVFQKYLKLIKPLYVKISRKHSEEMKFSGELCTVSSTTSSPSVVSVSSFRREKQGSFPAGIRGACKHLGKSKSASAVIGVSSPANRSDDTLLQQHDGIQSAILHCKRSFNSRDYASTITKSEDISTCPVRKSF